MPQSLSTCWSVIDAAAAGSGPDRDEFARRYGPVVRAYLAARWRGSVGLRNLDDAAQDVFVECFKQGGVLEQAHRGRGFRPYLYGVARNVALRFETLQSRQGEGSLDLDALPADEESLSRAFDRAWAKALVREAGRLQEERARVEGEAACRRVELLRLRFQEGLPIRAIAERWQTDAAVLHHEYAKARLEFKTALADVVAFHHPGTKTEVEEECANLLAILG